MDWGREITARGWGGRRVCNAAANRISILRNPCFPMRFAILALFLLGPHALLARCAGSGIEVFPQSHALPPNGRLVVQLYAGSQDLAPKLGGAVPVYLVESSGGRKIALKAVQTFTGGYRLAQVVLQPASLLLPGRTYTLKADRLPAGEAITGPYNEGKGTYDKAFWTVGEAAPDLTAPTWKRAPAYVRTVYEALGCGPHRIAEFSAQSAEDGEGLMVLTTLRGKATGRTTVFLLPLETGLLSVGHSMCSGGFGFSEQDAAYEVTFQPVDFAGNAGPSSGPYLFTRPDPAPGQPVEN